MWVSDIATLQDGTKVAGAGADKAARLLDLGSGQTTAQQVAAHDQPIRCVRFIDAPGSNAPMLVTGSWDKTVKYWDLRQSTPAATLECQERVYSLDVKDKLMVIATADRYINVVNLDQPTKFYKTMQSPLKWQTRVVSCFSDATGFAVGSIEGRCAIQYVEDKDSRYARTSPSNKPNVVARKTNLLSTTAPTSPSNATAKHPRTAATCPTFTPSTPSPSTPSTAPSAPPAQTALSTSGTKTPNIVSRATLPSAALSPQRASIGMGRSLRMRLAMIGVRAIRSIPRRRRIRSCCIPLAWRSVSRGRGQRSGRKGRDKDKRNI